MGDERPDPHPLPPRREARPRPRFTAGISDLHISDVEPVHPDRPLWRRHKQAEVGGDARLVAFLAHLRELSGGQPVELVLNGDVFDFDGVAAVPDDPPFPVSWLERARGLHPEEPKSAWKMRRILDHHPAVVAALRAWLAEGNTLVFVVGNHDLELHWPQVQRELRHALAPPHPDALTICEFFVVSGEDTLFTHGNQLDPYCVCPDPLHPLVESDGRRRVRLPFGSLAGKLMLNGMGLFNPYDDANFIRPLREYLRFFVTQLVRYQPLIAWDWLWSAAATLVLALDDGWRPAVRDPARLAHRENSAARRSRTTPATLRALREVSAHPAVFQPWRVARELWLDRALGLLMVGVLAFQLFSALHLLTGAGAVWAAVIFIALLPPFFFYAARVRSEVADMEGRIRAALPALARAARVKRVVMGHTHRAMHERIGDVDYFNTGHWAAAFSDAECTRPVGIQGFAWLRPVGRRREAELRRFIDGKSVVIAPPEAVATPAPPDRVTARAG